MPVIAMTRELATLGSEVCAGLAEQLGLDVVHHELVEHEIAARSGMEESEVRRFLAGESSLLERMRIDRKKMSRYTAQEILELAAKGNVLIRGWGATYLLRSVPHVLCVRICAPMAFRTEVMTRRRVVGDAAAARREIERNDAAHNGTMQRLFGVDWRDAALYAITLNTAAVPVEACVDHIVGLTRSAAFRETAQSRAILMDQLVEARVRSVLSERFDATPDAIGIGVAVKDSKVTLSGALSDERLIAEIVRRIHGVDGVVAVECRISYLTFARDVV